jgi:plastocyanin
MTRRFVPLALVLVLAAACAEPPEARIGFGSGRAFVPQVADAQDNVGLYPSIAINADGVPYVAYFGFPEEVSGSEVPLPRAIGAPSVPSVLLTNVNDGIWTRGAVAMEKAIPNVDIPFGPAEVPQIGSMKPENVNGTAVAIDQSGAMHVAWVANTGVWYAHNMDGTSFTASRIEKVKIDQRGPIGQPTVAVDDAGAPWVAYARTTADGQDVVVATPSGSSWTSQIVATIPLEAGGAQPGRTAIALLDGTPVVAFETDASVDVAVEGAGGSWERATVALGADPAGVSLAPNGDGGLVASYYAGDEVHAATTRNGTTWDQETVSSVGPGENDEGRSTGVGVDDGGTTYVTWYDPSADDVHLASGDGSDFSAIETSGTAGGDLPSLAVTPDGEAYVTWYNEVDQNSMVGAYGDVSGIEFAIKSPTPTGGTSQPTSQPTSEPTGGTGGQCTTSQGGKIDVVAENISFDTSCIEVTAGQKAVIRFVNKDAGTQHNIAVYPSADELTNPLFQGELVTGPDTVEYDVGPLEAGEYYFHCDVHATMNGTFKVVSGGGGGGAGGGGGGASGGGGAGGGGGNVSVTTEVTASGLAFDTNEIDLAAGEPTKLTFDNQDAGTPHNVAIYPSESEITPDKALFQGEVVTGPTKVTYDIPALDAGTYYFHCDIHPTMNGTVVVA